MLCVCWIYWGRGGSKFIKTQIFMAHRQLKTNLEFWGAQGRDWKVILVKSMGTDKPSVVERS